MGFIKIYYNNVASVAFKFSLRALPKKSDNLLIWPKPGEPVRCQSVFVCRLLGAGTRTNWSLNRKPVSWLAMARSGRIEPASICLDPTQLDGRGWRSQGSKRRWGADGGRRRGCRGIPLHRGGTASMDPGGGGIAWPGIAGEDRREMCCGEGKIFCRVALKLGVEKTILCIARIRFRKCMPGIRGWLPPRCACQETVPR